MAQHLSLTDRTLIERYISLDYTFSFIARKLYRSPTTIAREVKRYRTLDSRFFSDSTVCLHYENCVHRNVCNPADKSRCVGLCKFCYIHSCGNVCPYYVYPFCPDLEKAPYVCNKCEKLRTCKFPHAFYSAQAANRKYLKKLSVARRKPKLSPEQLLDLNELIAPLIKNGQSINHIVATNKDSIPVTERTIYNYIDSCALSIHNIDLPKKVRYRTRHPQKMLTKFEYEYRKGRTLEFFKSYLEKHPKLSIVEMDTVKGRRGHGKVLLTMIFRENNFMLIFLMNDGTQKSVRGVFDYLTEILSTNLFREIFPVILTDNGVEFKAPHELEFDISGNRRTHIFYCDPQASWQKPHVEKNHTLIRRILPKGTSFDFLEQNDIRLLMCHINSVTREIFDNFSPFDLMTQSKYKKLLDALSLSAVPPAEVCLTPNLLKRRK